MDGQTDKQRNEQTDSQIDGRMDRGDFLARRYLDASQGGLNLWQGGLDLQQGDLDLRHAMAGRKNNESCAECGAKANSRPGP